MPRLFPYFCNVHHRGEETNEGPPVACFRTQVGCAQKTAKPKTPVNGFAAASYVSKYTVGDRISHPMFGDGTVTAIDENKLTIEFPESVTKQIIDGYVTHRRA